MQIGQKHSKESLEKMRLVKLGHKLSEETKRKLSIFNKGKIISEQHKRQLSIARTGKPLSLEHRKKLSNSHLGQKAWNKGKSVFKIKGSKHWNWQGGKTNETIRLRGSLEYKLWRTAVFKRDNYTCIWCGVKGYLEADHVKPFAYFPELRFAIDNGRTLCKTCHKTTDTFGERAKKHNSNIPLLKKTKKSDTEAT